MRFDIHAYIRKPDILEIRDGDNEEAPLIGAFSGTDLPPLIQTTQSKMWMR